MNSTEVEDLSTLERKGQLQHHRTIKVKLEFISLRNGMHLRQVNFTKETLRSLNLHLYNSD